MACRKTLTNFITKCCIEYTSPERDCKIQRTLHVNEKSLKIPNGVIRSVNRRKTDSTKEKGQKDKQRSTKHCTEN